MNNYNNYPGADQVPVTPPPPPHRQQQTPEEEMEALLTRAEKLRIKTLEGKVEELDDKFEANKQQTDERLATLEQQNAGQDERLATLEQRLGIGGKHLSDGEDDSRMQVDDGNDGEIPSNSAVHNADAPKPTKREVFQSKAEDNPPTAAAAATATTTNATCNTANVQNPSTPAKKKHKSRNELTAQQMRKKIDRRKEERQGLGRRNALSSMRGASNRKGTSGKRKVNHLRRSQWGGSSFTFATPGNTSGITSNRNDTPLRGSSNTGGITNNSCPLGGSFSTFATPRNTSGITSNRNDTPLRGSNDTGGNDKIEKGMTVWYTKGKTKVKVTNVDVDDEMISFYEVQRPNGDYVQ